MLNLSIQKSLKQENLNIKSKVLNVFNFVKEGGWKHRRRVRAEVLALLKGTGKAAVFGQNQEKENHKDGLQK